MFDGGITNFKLLNVDINNFKLSLELQQQSISG